MINRNKQTHNWNKDELSNDHNKRSMMKTTGNTLIGAGQLKSTWAMPSGSSHEGKHLPKKST
jgi:hypothetical protein